MEITKLITYIAKKSIIILNLNIVLSACKNASLQKND